MTMRLLLLSLLLLGFFNLGLSSAEAVDAKDYDYFNPTDDPHIKWLIGDQKKYHLDVAVVRVREGDYERAIRELRFMLVPLPNHPQALALLGFVARISKQTPLAISAYEYALKIYPQYAITHAQYGKFLVEVGQIESGVAKLRHAIEMDPKLLPAYIWLTNAYSQKGDQENAREAASKARELGYNGKIPGEEPER